MGQSGYALLRTRWAAIGAAVAVTLGAGGFGLASASIDSGDKPVTVTVNSERALDTRFGTGLTGRFFSDVPRDLQITGPITVAASGGGTTTKTVVPTGATSVIANVTIVLPTHQGHISLRPADATGTPTGSNVNFGPGQVVPNAVTVALSPAGAMEMWLFTSDPAGNADVIVDIVGYTIDHNHDDRYYTRDQIDALLADKADQPSGAAALTIPSAAFTSISDVDNDLFWEPSFQSWGLENFADNCVAAAVTLPAGATITAVKVRYYNETGATSSTATTTLSRYQKSTQAVTTVATVTNGAGTTPATELATAPSITNPVVSDAFTYSAHTCFDAADVYMDYLEIEFTYPS